MEVVGNSSAASLGYTGGIPGPRDRTSFFEEQARNRRSTWRLAALCGITILLMGVAVSLVTVPLLLLGYIVFTEFLDVFFPFVEILKLPARAYLFLINPNSYPDSIALRIALPVLFISLPGILAAFLAWLFLQNLFRRHGVGAMLLSLGAREPDPSDIEEQQLTNIAHEMAIAAGVPPPAVRLLDSEVANAAVIGASRREATLIIPRRLLDELDRDETQGVIGHLIGSVGNGDLRIATLIVSVFQTSGLLLMVMEVPLSSSSRRGVLRILKTALSRGHQSAEEIHLLDDLLTERVAVESDYENEVMGVLEAHEREDIRTVRRVFYFARMMVLLPLILAWAFSRFFIMIFTLVLLGPLIALTWRTRRYLADATAVQLTRNPDGIARSLIWLADHGAVIPAGKWADHLFIIGPEAAKDRAEAKMKREFTRLREEYRGRPWREKLFDRSRQALDVQRAYQRELVGQDADTFGSRRGIVIGFHPSLKKRLKRLQRQGATISFGDLSGQEV
jgi:Zn-dependent protease with chaperone function